MRGTTLATLAALPLLGLTAPRQALAQDDWVRRCESQRDHGAVHCEVRTYSLPGTGGVLSLDTGGNGGIRLQVWDRTEVKVEARIRVQDHDDAAATALSEALGVAHEFAEKHGYEVNANQELNAHALANLVSALFGGMLASGSMSASAVKEGAGARSQVTNLVTWVVTIITVLFLTPLFTTLPEAVLAALIIHAVWHIIAARKLQQIRLVSRTEFWCGMLALAGVLLIDVLEGMIIGVVASLVLDLSIEPPASLLAGARTRRAGRLYRSDAASRECSGDRSVDRAPRRTHVLCQRAHRPRSD